MKNTAGCQTLCGGLLLLAHMERCIGKPRMNFPLQLHTLH